MFGYLCLLTNIYIINSIHNINKNILKCFEIYDYKDKKFKKCCILY